jgi:hypothetical protein
VKNSLCAHSISAHFARVSARNNESNESIIDHLVLLSLKNFQGNIRREFITGSEIAPSLYESAIGFVEDTGFFEPNYFLGQKVSHQWQTHKPHEYGALAVFQNEDSSPWQAKSENPRIDQKSKIQRYESIKGKGSRAFTPAITVGDWVKITKHHKLTDRLPAWVLAASKNGHHTLKSGSNGFGVDAQESSFWHWVEQYPEINIVLTEGGKKALALLSQGYVAIAGGAS